MIKINGKSYKEIIVMDRKNNVIAIINDKGKFVENNGAKVVLVANKNWQKVLHWVVFYAKILIWVIENDYGYIFLAFLPTLFYNKGGEHFQLCGGLWFIVIELLQLPRLGVIVCQTLKL